MYLDRTCPQCGQAFTGRKDKLYCSPACRAQNHRAQLAAEADVLAEDADVVDVALPARPVLPVPFAASPPGAAPARVVAPEKQRLNELIAETVNQSLQEHAAQAAQAAQQALHARYVRWAQTWLQQEGTPLSTRLVSQLRRETEQLSTDYQAHPAITQSQHPARLRLQLLYKIGDELRTLQQELQNKTTSFFGAAQPTDTLALSKKRRKLLRESLLGVA